MGGGKGERREKGEKGDKGDKVDKSEARIAQLVGKDYKDGLDDLCAKTAVKLTDIDDKAVQLLDFLQQNGGRAKEACQHLVQALEGLSREHVKNWRAYVYTLLRQFDEKAHEAYKAAHGRRATAPRPKGDKNASAKDKKSSELGPFNFNPGAPEFIPGAIWGTPVVQVPGQVAAGLIAMAGNSAVQAA